MYTSNLWSNFSPFTRSWFLDDKIQKKQVETATYNFNRSKAQYKLGSITAIEFRQAQINLTNAQNQRTIAKYQAKLAELQLIQITGQLLNVEI